MVNSKADAMARCDMYQCPRCARVWWVPSRDPAPRYCPYCGLEDEEELLLWFEGGRKGGTQ